MYKREASTSTCRPFVAMMCWKRSSLTLGACTVGVIMVIDLCVCVCVCVRECAYACVCFTACTNVHHVFLLRILPQPCTLGAAWPRRESAGSPTGSSSLPGACSHGDGPGWTWSVCWLSPWGSLRGESIANWCSMKNVQLCSYKYINYMYNVHTCTCTLYTILNHKFTCRYMYMYCIQWVT